MKEVSVYQYRVKDPVTGRRYLTRCKLTQEEAAERYPGGECLAATEEVRTIYDEGEIHSSHHLVFGSLKKSSP